jgi:hypothetical protein
MCKKAFLLIALLLIWTGSCFAEDIYIGDANGYAIYLKTDSITCEATKTPGSEIATIYYKYSTVSIPHDDKLVYLQKFYIQDKLAYRIDNFNATLLWNRFTHEYSNDTPYVVQEDIEICDSSGKVLMDFEGSNGTNVFSDSDSPSSVVTRNTFLKVDAYRLSHKEIVNKKNN